MLMLRRALALHMRELCTRRQLEVRTGARPVTGRTTSRSTGLRIVPSLEANAARAGVSRIWVRQAAARAM